MEKLKKDLYIQNEKHEYKNHNDEYALQKECKTSLDFMKFTALQKCQTLENSSHNIAEGFSVKKCIHHKYNTRHLVCTYCDKRKTYSDSDSICSVSSGAETLISTVNNVKEHVSYVRKSKFGLWCNKQTVDTKSSEKKTKETKVNNKILDIIKFPSDLKDSDLENFKLPEDIKMFKKDKKDFKAETLKAEALRKGRTLKICLKKIDLNYKDSIVINIFNKSSKLQTMKFNRNIPPEYNTDTGLADLKLHTNNVFLKCKKSVVQTTNDIKKQQHNNKIRYKKKNIWCTDFKFQDTHLVKTDSPINNITNNTENKQVLNSAQIINRNYTPNIINKESDIYSEKNKKNTLINDKECSDIVEFCNDNDISHVLSNNYSFEYAQKCTLVDTQKNTKEKEEHHRKSTETLHHLEDSKNLQKQKRLNNDENNTVQSAKKIKLNKTNWYKLSKIESRTSDMNKCTDVTKNVVDSNTVIKVPHIIDTSTNTLNTSVQEDNGVKINDVLVTEENLNITQDISDVAMQNSVQTFGYNDVLKCNTQNNTENLVDVVAEICESSANNATLPSKKTSFNSESFVDDDDCISLYADTNIIEEYNIPEIQVKKKINNNSLHSKKSYIMTDRMFDNYYRTNVLEFENIYETKNKDDDNNNNINNNNNNNNNNNILQRGKQFLCSIVEKKSNTASSQNLQRHKSTETVNKKTSVDVFSSFRGYCHQTIRKGNCVRKDKNHACHFSHKFIPIMTKLYTENEQYFFEVIDGMISQKYGVFLLKFFRDCVTGCVNTLFTLKLLKKLYNTKIITNEVANETIAYLKDTGSSMKVIVNYLTAIVDINDTEFIMDILIIISNYVVNNEYWSLTKYMFMKVKKLKPRVINVLLRQCSVDQTYVQEIYENVISKLSDETCKRVNKRLLSTFNNTLKQIKGNTYIKEIEMASTRRIASPDPMNVTNEPENALYINRNVNTTPKVWKDDLYNNNNSTENISSPILLHPIDNLSNPYSVHGRERFWKFYVDVYSLQKGLEHNDYEHVKQILDAAEERQVCQFTRACYNILRNEIERSQYHLSMLACLGAQSGASSTFYKILNNVTIHILAKLAERELWVLALQLLKTIEIILHEENSICKFDAVVLMLFAKIYLANHKPLKAFTLLQKSNIIYMYRDKWKVRSNRKDENIRVQVITLLLNMLCETSLKHAYFLFTFLMMDQSSNFYPIDLSSCANKVVSSLLLKNDHDLIVNVVQLIDNYNFTLKTITYRALISCLVHIDLTLAKQLYKRAVLLGVYPRIEFHPTIYVIVKSDWSYEEMYLTILILMQELAANAGHAINGISSKLPVYLFFENIPSEEQLVHDEGENEHYENKIKQSKLLMKKVLKEQFDPSLSLVSRKKGKLQKLNSINLHKYLHLNQSFI